MLAPINKVVVDKKEEQKFRRRALRHKHELMEAMWGYIRGDVAYICAFMKFETGKVTPRVVSYTFAELDNHEDDAKDTEIFDSVTGQKINLEFLGTIHTHPDRDYAVLSEFDIYDSLETQETILGICAIEVPKDKMKHKTLIAYYPALRPLAIERKKEYNNASFAAKAGSKRRAKKAHR